MRKQICLAFFVLVNFLSNAQSPQALNYQAIARTAEGSVIPDQTINVRFTILDENITGTTLYSETHKTKTNTYGLFTLAIGRGTAVTSAFTTIDWGSGTEKFLKVEIAVGEGNSYQLQGTTQLLSVPFALYAEKTRLIADNNTIKITNGNKIRSNYQAGEGIRINGNVISSNLTAGKGVIIKGNSISSSSGAWIIHKNGIYYPASKAIGNVGIGTPPVPNIGFVSSGDIPGVYEGNAGMFTSNSPWHTIMNIKNNKTQFSFIVGGPSNRELKPNNFGILNGIHSTWALTINGANNNIGIGDPSPYPTPPKSSLHIKQGDIYLEQIRSGIIMRSPNGQCWRVTIDNSGNLLRTAITCPN